MRVGLGLLFAIGLAACEDPEPVASSSRRVAPSSDEPSDRAPRAQDERSQPGESAQPAALDSDCDHPFVPSRPGDWRRYTWRQSDMEQRAELRLEALSIEALDDGQRRVTWQASVTSSGDDSRLARERIRVRCRPGEDAEEPWFGILELALGLRPTAAERWRWPVELRQGQRFEGTAVLDPRDAEMRRPAGVDGPVMLRVTRSHVVGARETVEVPAGRFEAHRIDYEERQAFGDRGETGSGVLWVAPAIGLVKATAENASGIEQTIELAAHSRVD